MGKLTLTLALTVALATAASAAAPPPAAQVLYADAMAKEEAVRKALADPEALPTVLKAVRTVVADYEAVVRHHPASGYCDDALWNAAQLSLDAFKRFGEARERTTGVRLLKGLASGYPASKFAKQAPGAIATIEAIPVRQGAVTPAARTGKPRSLVSIRDIRRTVLPDGVRITIELDGEVPFYDEKLQNPVRVFVDLGSTRPSPALIDRTIRFESDADIVRQVRIGRHPNNTTRVVLDAGGVSTYSVYPLYAPYRLVIDCVRETPAGTTPPATIARAAPPPPIAAAVLPLRGKHVSAPAVSGPPSAPPLAAAAIDEARRSETPTLPATPTAPVTGPPPAPAAPPARNLAGGFSLARQLGLGVSRIVIDPGHGGHDPGAKGRGISESELVLDVALRLEKLLAEVPGVEVILTRRSNEYLPLQERTAIANREGADLFLSIHANASNNTVAQGVETYFLNLATNQSAAAVAARENAASGQAMGALPDLLKTIALHSKRDESRDLAIYVQRAMIDKLRPANRNVKDLGVKQAPFMVLIGAAMPSVLAEIAFVTNAQEAKLLKTGNYKQRIAEALFTAIRKYQTSLKTEGKVAQQ